MDKELDKRCGEFWLMARRAASPIAAMASFFSLTPRFTALLGGRAGAAWSSSIYLFLIFISTVAWESLGQNLPPAAEALRAGAEAGNAVAQFKLGMLFASGKEVPPDPVLAA